MNCTQQVARNDTDTRLRPVDTLRLRPELKQTPLPNIYMILLQLSLSRVSFVLIVWNPIVFVASSSLEAVKIHPPSQQTAVLHIIHSHYHVHVLLLLLSVSDYILHNENCSNVAANILSNLAPDWWKQWMHGQGLPLFNGQSGPGNLILLYKIKCPQKDSLPQISFSETYVYCSKFNKNERKLYVICRAVTISTMLSWSILTLELLSLTCCYGQWQC